MLLIVKKAIGFVAKILAKITGKMSKQLCVYAIERINTRLARHQPIVLVFASVLSTYLFLRFRRFWHRSEKSLWSRFKNYAFAMVRKLPSIQRRIREEMQPKIASIVHSIHECDKERDFIRHIPSSAMSSDAIIQRAIKYEQMNEKFDYSRGRVSGSVYSDIKEDHLDVLTKVFQKYAFSNPLHPDVFPGARKMEAEVIRMVANLYNGSEEACGTMSSGGTESILLACFAHRNRALARGIDNPIIVAPVTAHAAFEKAANVLGIKIRLTPVDHHGRANVKAMRKAISRDVCMLVGSAPCFSTGTMDDIPEIAKLGERYKIPVHVDACLGSFIVPFMEELGLKAPVFDFRLAGVCSISCDTHKYGYSPKGSSTILYRSAEYLHHQYFSITDWPGGIYATPTFAGSRAGLNIALTWATLLHFGRDTYRDRAFKIIEAKQYLVDQLKKIPGIKVVGSPDVMVVAFRSNEFNIYAVGDALNRRGWNLNSLQDPDAIHFCLTYNQASHGLIDSFLTDLAIVCEEVRVLPDRGGHSDTARIYGMAGSIPESLIDEVAHIYLDACYAMPPK